MSGYVHGYSPRERERLHDQANTLEELLHHDTHYPPGSRVLEVGCGVGATSAILGRRHPAARFVSIDRSPASLTVAKRLIRTGQGFGNFEFVRTDLYRLPFPEASFDHVFVCFLLEHLTEPERALETILTVLKPGGTATVIEGDHGSCYFHPHSEAAQRAWNCLIEVQARLGGNSLIGRELLPRLTAAGLREVTVTPRVVYCDATRPGLMDGFVKKTIIPMVEGVHRQAIDWGLIGEDAWRQGIADLHRTGTPPTGTFCYTFFKGVGVK
ncbi:MAG: methyltransferase domain-containing protein [SAR324 cluster bacterium]|nr:methyltransferase domain-containing protein [SAR324 cluster bacterium]